MLLQNNDEKKNAGPAPLINIPERKRYCLLGGHGGSLVKVTVCFGKRSTPRESRWLFFGSRPPLWWPLMPPFLEASASRFEIAQCGFKTRRITNGHGHSRGSCHLFRGCLVYASEKSDLSLPTSRLCFVACIFV